MGGKKLTIVYGDSTLYDEVPQSFTWSEDRGRIKVEAGAPAANPLGQMVQAALANSKSKRSNGHEIAPS